MIGHRVTNPQMFGVLVPGKLGGGAELAESAEQFDEQVVQPMRDLLIETCTQLLRASGVPEEAFAIGTAVEEANVEQSYTGIQVSSAIDIIAKVGLGELTQAQAIQLLVTMLQFPQEAAERMFQEPAETMLAKVDLSEAFNYLIDKGETMGHDCELVDE